MRPAIAMIELIFAIVVIGITLMSAPMLINQASTSGYVAIQQESIAHAASQMGLILTRAWDEQDTNATLGSPILSTTYTNTQLDFTTTTPQAGMTIGSPSRVYTHVGIPGVLVPASNTLQADGADEDDIDDFDGLDYNLSVFNSENIATAIGDVIDKNIAISVNVEYGDDIPKGVSAGASINGYQNTNITFSNPFNNSAVTGTSNIKLITVVLTTSAPTAELNKSISLGAFSCNIGSFTTKRLVK